MDNVNKLSTLLNVINQLFAVDDYGVNHVEFLFIEVGNLLEEDKVVRKIFFNKLMEKVNDSSDVSKFHDDLKTDIDSDLLCYLAYTTRWAEFYEFVERRQAFINNQSRVRYSKDLSDGIQEALEDNWEDVIFYNEIK